MPRGLFAPFALAVACRSQPDPNAAMPIPLPSATVVATASASAAPQSPPKRVCEPTITCGRWSRCRWLELDSTDAGHEVYRVAGSDAGGYGSRYWRQHHCWPVDGGPKDCAIYCAAKGACVDGFGFDGICTVSGPPRPSPWVCEVRGDECITHDAP